MAEKNEKSFATISGGVEKPKPFFRDLQELKTSSQNRKKIIKNHGEKFFFSKKPLQKNHE